MSEISFSISSEATAHIRQKVQDAQTQPNLTGLLPGLYFFLDQQSKDEEGRVFEWCPYPFFDVCWQSPETAAAEGYVEIEIAGLTLASPRETLRQLEGRQLVVEFVEVGFPTPAAAKRPMLRAK